MSTIIFLHNGGASSVIWKHVSDHLENNRKYDIHLIDLPGYGNSREKALTLEGYVKFLESYIEKHKITQVILIGNCMGSAISYLYALKNPNKVSGLILFNPLSLKTFRKGSLGYLLKIDKYPIIFDSLLPIVSSIQVPSIIISKIIEKQVNNKLDDSDLNSLCKCYSNSENIISLRSLLKELPKFSEMDKKIDKKIDPFIILGSKNKILSPDESLVECLGPRLIISLDNCGHLPMLEDPKKVISIIDRILINSRL